MTRSRVHLLFVGLAVLVAGLSLTLYFVPNRELVRRVVFFPRSGATAASLGGELKSVPVRKDRLGDLAELAIAAVQGPMSYSFSPICDPRATVRGVYEVNNIAYVDLDMAFLAPLARADVEPDLRLRALRETILYNIPAYQGVRILLGGQESGAWPHVAK